MPTQFEVVVIGAGPAGAATAYWLACSGVKVALVDEAAFPRDKACGDMLSDAAVRQLEHLGLTDFLNRYLPKPTWRAQYGAPSGWHADHTIRTHDRRGRLHWATVPRFILDAAIVDLAQRAGAVLFEHIRVNDIEATPTGIRLQNHGLQSKSLSAQVAVIAVGSVGRLAKGRAERFALRGYYAGATAHDLNLNWDADLGSGYWWQFPQPNDTYNLGIYIPREQIPEMNLITRLSALATKQNLTELSKPRGGLVNSSLGQLPLHSDRMLWVGDAAGLVMPHLGEGIAPALLSAEIAAECALQALSTGNFNAADLAGYTHKIHKALDGQMRLSRSLAQVMKHPKLFEAIAYPVAIGHQRLFGMFSSRE